MCKINIYPKKEKRKQNKRKDHKVDLSEKRKKKAK